MGQMVVAIQCAWKGVSKDVLDVHISTMPHRIKVVNYTQGGNIVLDGRQYAKIIQIDVYFIVFYVKILYNVKTISLSFPLHFMVHNFITF